MLSSVDGRSTVTRSGAVIDEAEYEATSEQFKGNAWLCGRTTMQEILDDDEPFVSTANTPAGPQPVQVGRRAESYAVCVDTRGKLRWTSGDLRGDHLVCILSEQVPADYLAMLREKGASYIVAGSSSVDLSKAMDLLGEHFGIRTLTSRRRRPHQRRASWRPIWLMKLASWLSLASTDAAKWHPPSTA